MALLNKSENSVGPSSVPIYGRQDSAIELQAFPIYIHKQIMEDDYETYSDEILQRYFKLKLVESMDYRDIGAWWNPKGYIDNEGHQQSELDIVALRLKENILDVIDVKRNPDKFNKGLPKQKALSSLPRRNKPERTS